MKKLILIIFLMTTICTPVYAQELTAPSVPNDVQDLMPQDTQSFGEGLWYVISSGIRAFQPEIASGARICLTVMACVMLTSLLSSFPGMAKNVTELASAIVVACLLLSSTETLIQDAAETVTELSEYGKLFIPVMTAAMAAQGGVTASATLYAGTAMFDAVLCTLISSILVPIIYVFLALSVANSALSQEVLKKLRDLTKWGVSWCLKTLLYVFTGYISITGVVSGAADQTALKATKLTISGMVPVVGGILSDASEAVLVSAGLVKSAIGVYGLLAVCAIAIGPFLRIGAQYLLLKLTAAVCALFGSKRTVELIQDFSGAMGLLLAMTGAVSLLLLISTVCFLKGMS